MGVVQTGPDHFEEADVLLRSADRRMYLNKPGRDDREMNDQA